MVLQGCRTLEGKTLMFHKRTLFLSIVVAALVGILVAFLATILFPGWSDLSPFVRGAVIGAFAGPVYPLLARRLRS